MSKTKPHHASPRPETVHRRVSRRHNRDFDAGLQRLPRQAREEQVVLEHEDPRPSLRRPHQGGPSRLRVRLRPVDLAACVFRPHEALLPRTRPGCPGVVQ